MTDEEDVCSECYRGWGSQQERADLIAEIVEKDREAYVFMGRIAELEGAADQMAGAIKTKLKKDFRRGAPDEPGLRAALSNYLKAKDG